MRRTLVAVAVLLVLLAAAHVFRVRKDREARRKRAQARLVEVDEQSLRAMVLVTQGAEWRFTRGKDGWRLVEPVKDTADTLALQEVLGALNRARVSRVVESADSLVEYGLDPPVATLRLEGNGTVSVDLGHRTPTGTGLFADVAGRPGVLVVEVTTAAPLLNLTPDGLRDPTLSGVPRAGVTEAAIRAAGNTIGLALEGETWWIVEPVRLPAFPAGVERFFAALDGTRVQRYLDGADASDPKFGLGESALHITLKAGSVRRRIVLGAPASPGGRYAVRDDRGTVLVVDAAPLSSLPQSVNDLATRRLTVVNRYQVARFSYALGGEKVEASSDAEGAWTDAAGRSLDADNVYTFLVRILAAPVRGFREGGIPPGRILAVLEWTGKSGVFGKAVFYAGNLATVSTAPGIVFRLSSPPPPLPAFR